MNRRDFFRVVTLSAFAAQFGKIDRLFADSTVPLDPNIVAIFSDIHLRNPETIQAVVRFNQCVAQVLAMNPRPAQLLIYGDLAYNAGTVNIKKEDIDFRFKRYWRESVFWEIRNFLPGKATASRRAP